MGQSPTRPPTATFLGLPYVPAEAAALKQAGAKAALLGVPYDMSAIYRSGTAAGPRGLRDASRQYGPYFFDDDVDFVTDFALVDCGDVTMIPAAPERCRANTRTAALEILRSDAIGVFIGGDHSIPIPLGEALSQATEGGVGYIVFDANMDAEEEVDGERYSNWSEFCRLCELPNVNPHNMVLIGIRGALNTRRQVEYIRDVGAHLFSMRDVIERGIVDVMTDAIKLASAGTSALYVSFDTDGIDAAYAPGTSGPEPGGLTSREILTAARMLGEHGVTMFDIVEYCPPYDPSDITGKLCCYIIFNVLGAHYATLQRRCD
jgi:arginase family enzyme